MNEKDIKVEITMDGSVVSIYSDETPLALLGELQVTRLSDVEFDSPSQTWIVKFRNGVVLPRTFKSRIEAINAEIDYVEAHLSEFGEWVRETYPERIPTLSPFYCDPGCA